MVKEIKLKGSKSEVEFVDSLELMRPVMTMNAFGLDTSGKTRFAMTGPEIVGYIPMDRKTRRTVEIMGRQSRKHFLIPKEDFIRQINPLKLNSMDDKAIRDHYTEHIDRVKDAIYALHAHKDVQVICVDFGSQLYQDICYSLYGREFQITRIGGELKKDRKEANQVMIDIINAISDKHLILTAKSKDEWVNNKSTGRSTNEGFQHTGYHCNMSVEFINNPKWNPDADDGKWHYGLAVRRCQDQPSLETGSRSDLTLYDDEITFNNLAMMVWPDNADLFMDT